MRSWFVIGASALSLSLASCGGSDGGTADVATVPAKIGEVIRIGEAEYAVTSVEQVASVGGEYMEQKASEGATLVIVNWTMKNAGAAPIEFYDKAVMHLVDPAGVEYSSDDEATIAYQMQSDLSEKSFGDLNPGITSRGADVYEVSSTAFDAAAWGLVLEGSDKRVSLQ